MRTIRYVGGVEVAVELPSGRVAVFADGDTAELLPAEYKLLIARTDFEPVAEPPHVEPKEKP